MNNNFGSTSVSHKNEGFIEAEKSDVRIADVDKGCPSYSAVYIRNLCKSYGNSDILRNFSMNVRKGTIYGLLGASGCGKTTVLSTIVGLKKWDSGNVFVLGEAPGNLGKRLGYVPQEVALYYQLTLREVMEFYGRMYNMPSHEIGEKYVSLTRLLDFPTGFKLIGNLSGGQKRRASLAVALMHSPSLLVLDEPTVGLDPLLRTRIWDHLYDIVSTLKTTVIITTHYIEEARFSNTIGVMRKGRLLVEDSPTNLLQTLKCEHLEDVVLQLCREDEVSPKMLKHENQTVPKGKVTSTHSISQNDLNLGSFIKADDFDSELDQDMCHNYKVDDDKTDNTDTSVLSKLRNSSIFQSIQRIKGLSTVMFLTFSRHPIFIILILLVPAAHAMVSLLSLGNKPKGMSFGVVNKELPNWIAECDTSKYASNSCDFSSLSCKYLNHLKGNNLFQLNAYDNETSALEEVKMGRAWGYMVFGNNYSQHNFDFMAAQRFATNESIEGSRIKVRLDHSQYIGSFFLIKDLYSAFHDYIRSLASACGVGGKEAELPLNFREPIYGTDKDDNTDYIIPSILFCCTNALLGILTSLIFINDRKQGNLSRAHVAGVRTMDVVLSHMITQAFVALIQLFIWTVILYAFFGFVINGPVWLYVLIFLSNALCGATMGLLLGVVCTEEQQALVWIALFWGPTILAFGGVYWPIEAVPAFWKPVGYLFPTTLPIMSLRSVTIRGLGIDHDLVWPGVLVSLGWTIFVPICVVLVYKRHLK